MNRTIIKEDGTTVNYSPRSGGHYELDELQSIVGGYIQIISLHDGRLMVINDEGKQLALPMNSLATDIALEQGAIFANDFIVGDVLICREGDIL